MFGRIFGKRKNAGEHWSDPGLHGEAMPGVRPGMPATDLLRLEIQRHFCADPFAAIGHHLGRTASYAGGELPVDQRLNLFLQYCSSES
jgi:hypothetical protein